MKGILNKPDMIRAIVEGRKTQTRRVIPLANRLDKSYDHKWVMWSKRDNWWLYKGRSRYSDLIEPFVLTPRYQVGETVYIKEAWWNNGFKGTIGTHYKLSCDLANPPWQWKSPLFMPEWAARYFIKIKGVTPQRLQEITQEDVIAEGIDYLTGHADKKEWTHLNSFVDLWDSINKAYPWESNCWVWKYELELLTLYNTC